MRAYCIHLIENLECLLLYGDNVKPGYLIYDKIDKRYGLVISKDWYTSIGTPFDWLVLWCSDGTLGGADEKHCEVINENY